jgi:hypothetical protein
VLWHDPRVTDQQVPASGTTAVTTDPSPTGPSRLADLTDDELVQRAQSGNSRAFELLLRRHQRSMFGTSLRLLSQDK